MSLRRDCISTWSALTTSALLARPPQSFVHKAPGLPPLPQHRSSSTSSGPSTSKTASPKDTPAQPRGLLFNLSPAVGSKRSREQLEQLEGLDAEIQALSQQWQQQRQSKARGVPALVDGDELVSRAHDGWRARRTDFKRLRGES